MRRQGVENLCPTVKIEGTFVLEEDTEWSILTELFGNIDVANRITEIHARPSSLEVRGRRRHSGQDIKMMMMSATTTARRGWFVVEKRVRCVACVVWAVCMRVCAHCVDESTCTSWYLVVDRFRSIRARRSQGAFMLDCVCYCCWFWLR